MDPSHVLSNLLDDVYNDLDYSADLREDLKKISGFIGKEQKLPTQRAGHRWLSIYDSSSRFLEISDSLSLLYSAWFSEDEKKQYNTILSEIMKQMKTKEDKAQLNLILFRLKKKKLTDAEKARKRRIKSKKNREGT